MKNEPDYGKIKVKTKPINPTDVDEDFDFGSYLGLDSDASDEEIDEMWQNQMC